MKIKHVLLTTLALALSLQPVLADEGMWLLPYLQKLNIKDMKSKGLKLSAEDIYSINKSSIKDAVVIFGGGCTGEIVSAQGLLLTNHHCGYGAIQQHSSVEHDYLKNGFWAMSQKEEIPTPGLRVTFIRRFEDVTDQIIPFLNDEMSEAERQDSIDSLMRKIIEDTEVKDSEEIRITRLFGENQFMMVVMEIYPDVRMVGAPPSAIGKFGGDTDNWMWPRHTGDFSMFRVYADADGNPAEYSPENVPYAAPTHLKISTKGIKEGDFAMVIGFPGSTERYKTSYEIAYTLRTDNPNRIFIRGERQELMMEDMKASDKIRIQYASKYAGSSNYWKNSIGMSRALKRLKVKEEKEQIEQQFTNWAASDPSRSKYMEALPLIKKSVESLTDPRSIQQYLSETMLRGIEIISPVPILSQMFQQEEAISEEAKQIAVGRLEQFYKDYSVSTDRKIAKRMLKILQDSIAAENLPSSFSVIRDNFGGNVDEYVDYIYDNSLFACEKCLMKFMENPDKNVFLNDPAYKMRRELVKTYNQQVVKIIEAMPELEKGQRLYIDGLMKMDPARKWYPDANFTMRLSYGQVLPYKPQDAVYYDYYTTLSGVIAKEDPENAYEFTVPDKLKELYYSKDFGSYGHRGDIPVNFISNNDITGGNSGSPVLNGRGELIGLAFDGNWEAMSGDVVFEPELQRMISVDVRYVLFIIDKYAGARHLIDEMTLVK